MKDRVDVKLEDICEFISGGTPDTKVPRYFQGKIPWITGADITGNIVSKARSYITEEAIEASATNVVPKGNILLVTRTSVGKVAVTGVDICISQDFTGLLPDKTSLNEWFLFYYLVTKQPYFTENQRGATIQGIPREIVANLAIPLPPLPEQQRIAAILTKADRLRRLRRYALDLGESYLQSVFLAMFGNLTTNPKGWHFSLLGDLSDLASGVTKGQKFNGKATSQVPYLRVANVQDGYLDLSEIKTIEALPADVEALRLQVGDILMTEGGDFDKLGRGAIWKGEIPNCIHQNHIFRVRFDGNIVMPEYFANLLLTQHAKEYFLRASKQTTNLATINMTQLKQLPVALPPLPLQQKFTQVVHKYERVHAQQREAVRQAEQLFQTLLQRAFAGALS